MKKLDVLKDIKISQQLEPIDLVLWYESVDRLWTRVRVRTLDNY